MESPVSTLAPPADRTAAADGACTPAPTALAAPFALYCANGSKAAFLGVRLSAGSDTPDVLLGGHFKAWPIPQKVAAVAGAVAKRRPHDELLAAAREVLAKHALRIDAQLAAARRTIEEHLAACAADGVPPWPHNPKPLAQLDAALETLPRRLTELRTAAVARRRLDDTARRIGQAIVLSQYPDGFPAAHMARRFVAVLGPTNSGKTHQAFERLAQAASGVYLAPLRLLALEAHQRLTAQFGTPCALLTGEESREVPGARHLAATVEMLDPGREVDLIVIDEVQMLGDAERGAAWTQAIVAANAREVWLLGSPSAEAAVRVLAERLGVPLEVRHLARKQPLVCAAHALAKNPAAALKLVQSRDCLIVFSRRDALQLRDDLMGRGHRVACVYGALTPEVRESEAARFASGEADVLVATDAIAMGLNLPIARIIFTAVQKYDGIERGDLPVQLTQQIAGRAGRYGHAQAGVVVGLTPDEHRLVQQQMAKATPAVPAKHFAVAPTLQHLQEIAEVCDEQRLAALLALFVQHVTGGGVFVSRVGTEQLERAQWLDANTALSLEAKVAFSVAPMNTREPEMLAAWQDWARSVEAARAVMLDHWRYDPAAASLAQAEFVTRLLAGYRWCARKFPDLFVDREMAEQMLAPWSGAVERLLSGALHHGQAAGRGPQGLPSWYWRYQ